MFGALRKLWIPKPPETVAQTYIALVAAARNPFFYTTLKVPDTVDGRFEMIVLHLFLLERYLMEGGLTPPSTPAASGSREALRTEPAATERQAFAQFLSEAFFDDLDRSLREMGVADTGVAHRIKRMGKAYHGRLQAYAQGLGDETALRAALARNLYGTVAEGDVQMLQEMARYVQRQWAMLQDISPGVILNGTFVWPDVETLMKAPH